MPSLALAQSMIGILSYFLVMRYVVRAGGTELVGLWGLTVGFVSFLRLVDFSGSSGLSRLVAISADTPRLRAGYIDTTTIWIVGFYTIIALLAYWPIRIWLTGAVPADLHTLGISLLLIAIVSMPLGVLGVAESYALDGLGRTGLRVAINVGGQILFVLAALILLPRLSILGLAYAQLLQFSFVVIAARVMLSRSLQDLPLFPWRFSKEAAKVSIPFGIKLQVMSLPMALFDPLARIALNNLAGLSFVGVYDLTYKIAGNVRTIIQATMTPYIPRLAHAFAENQAEARVYAAKISGESILFTSGAYSLMFMLAPLFSIFLLGGVSDAFVSMLSIMGLAWGISTYGIVHHLTARATGIVKWSIIGQWLIILFGVMFYVLIRFGHFPVNPAIGVATAVLAGHLTGFVLEVFAFGFPPAPLNRLMPIVLAIIVLATSFTWRIIEFGLV